MAQPSLQLLRPSEARPPEEPSWREALAARTRELWAEVRTVGGQPRADLSPGTTVILADAIQWLGELPPYSIHAVVTDPPYSLVEYDAKNHAKLRAGRGGV